MKTLSALIILLAPQERVSPDLLDYQPGGTLKGALELGPPGGFETLLTRWGDRMKAHHPDLRGGAPDAVKMSTPQALTEGIARLGIMSRRWTTEEAEDFHLAWGYFPAYFHVAGDGTAIIVHPENPVKGLLLEQVDAIFSSTRRRGGKPVRTWGDLGVNGEWRGRPLHLVGPSKESKSRQDFQARALQGSAFAEGFQEVGGDDAVLSAVCEDPCAIGFVRASARTDGARTVPIAPVEGQPAVEPQSENILALTYPLSWRITIAVRKGARAPADPEIAELLKLILSRDGQTIVAEEGLIPVTGRFAKKELSKLK
jgi:phosphate transport system substrate-binding protein